MIKAGRLRCARHEVRMKEGRIVCRILPGIPTRKRPLGRPRRRWKDSIRLDLKEIGEKSRN
jgi:hypothetical protein